MKVKVKEKYMISFVEAMNFTGFQVPQSDLLPWLEFKAEEKTEKDSTKAEQEWRAQSTVKLWSGEESLLVKKEGEMGKSQITLTAYRNKGYYCYSVINKYKLAL